jgi:hypothetical protein
MFTALKKHMRRALFMTTEKCSYLRAVSGPEEPSNSSRSFAAVRTSGSGMSGFSPTNDGS